MGRVWKRLLHVLVLALVLPLCLSSALPIFARALGGPAVHVCHCAAHGGPASCGCPICNPDRDDLAFSEESLRGKCGDDDLAFGAALGSAVAPPAGVTVVAPDLFAQTAPSVSDRFRSVFLTPPTPPPRSAQA
jgi:hypothetical protein